MKFHISICQKRARKFTKQTLLLLFPVERINSHYVSNTMDVHTCFLRKHTLHKRSIVPTYNLKISRINKYQATTRRNIDDSSWVIYKIALILRIRWPFSQRKFNMTTSRNYFNLDFIWEVCAPKTDVVVYSLLTKYSQIFLQKYTIHFLIFFSQLHLPVPFRSNV